MAVMTARGTDEQPDQEEPNHWSRTLIAIAIMAMTLATIAFVLRLYSRRKTNWKVAIEDLFMGLGLLCSYGLNICVIIAALNGVGHNVWALPEQTQGRAALLFWLGQKFWALAHTFVKLSIVLLIRRLLHTVGPWQAVTTALIVFTVAWGITAVIGNAFQCTPARYFWERDIDGHCSVHQQAFSISIGSLAMFEDAVLLLIPVLIVWRLTLECAEKIRITLLFSVGGLVCVFSILRVIELIHYQTDNLTANGSLEGIWAMLEISLGIVCACVVLMRPLFHDCHIFFRRHFGSEKNSSSANDSVVNSATSVQKLRLDSWSPEPWSSEAETVW